jgi:hypothetical protein
MPGITLGIHLFLLQAYYVEDDPMQAMIVIIAIVVIIAVVIVFRFINRGGKSPIAGGGYATAKGYNSLTLRRAAAPYGLVGEQVKLLDYVFRNGNVSNPARIIRDSNALDRHFKRAYRNIARDSRDPEKTQQNLSKLFLLRNTIEAAIVEDNVTSSMPVKNTQAVINCNSDNYNVTIYFSNNRTIITEIPKNTVGTSIKVNSGTIVNLTYSSRSNNSYSLTCSYTGIEKTEQGAGFKLNSTDRPKPLRKRQTRRKQIDIRCEFFFVQLQQSGTGKNATSKLVVSPKKFSGNIRDISAGGCSIKTPAPVQAASRLKINCNVGNNEQISVLGQVIRSNRSSAGTVINVKFLKVPLRAYNSINTMVFGFNESRG